MFKFDFGKNENEEPKDQIEEENAKNWLESEEHFITNLKESVVEDDCEVNLIEIEGTKIYHVSVDILVEKMKNEDKTIGLAENNHSDLVTSLYEGGLKVWECTYDLAKYILQEKINFESKSILDLGCGTGIIGILAYLKGANVCFQDYNPEVLKYVTIPNVLLNTEENSKEESVSRCKFYSGDWTSFLKITESIYGAEENKFDYIFTSETIYNPENYIKLYNIFRQLLKRNGTVYLAAKTYYFGVGGSIREFEDLLKKEESFKYQSCWKTLDGVQREILKITLNS